MKNKIIFLDIDGVLNLIPQGFDKYGAIFHPHFVDNLRKLIDATDAKIVISSTWRMGGLDTMRNMWNDRKLPGVVIDVTPNLYYAKIIEDDMMGRELDVDTRGHEIQKWINDNDISTYVIIDDDTDMLPSQMDNFVRTSENPDHPDCIDIGYGLTNICAQNAIKILNKQ